MKDKDTIQYIAMQEECRRLNEERYGNDVFLNEIKEDLKRLNEKVDDLMLVVEDIVKDTPGYKEAELMMQFV